MHLNRDSAASLQSKMGLTQELRVERLESPMLYSAVPDSSPNGAYFRLPEGRFGRLSQPTIASK